MAQIVYTIITVGESHERPKRCGVQEITSVADTQMDLF